MFGFSYDSIDGTYVVKMVQFKGKKNKIKCACLDPRSIMPQANQPPLYYYVITKSIIGNPVSSKQLQPMSSPSKQFDKVINMFILISSVPNAFVISSSVITMFILIPQL